MVDTADDGAAAEERSAMRLLTLDDVPWLFLALFVAIGLRAAWVMYIDVDPNDGRFADSVFFHNAARLLAETGSYVDPYSLQPTAQWPPGYPAALAVVYKLFGFHLGLAKALNIAFAAVTVAATYLIARQAFDRRAASLAALAVACFPGQIYFTTITMTEVLFGMTFILVLLLALVWTVQRPNAAWWQLLLIGLLIGYAGLVRSEGVALVFVLVATWMLLVRPWRRVATYALLVSAGTALALVPWVARNAVQLDEVIILRANTEGLIAHSLDPEVTRPRIFEERRFTAKEGLRHFATHPWEQPLAAPKRIKGLYENDSDAIRFILRNQSAFGVVIVPTLDGDELLRVEEDPAYFQEAVERPLLSKEEQSFWRRLADTYFFIVGAAALAGIATCLYLRNRAGVLLIVALAGWTLIFGFIPPSTRFHYALGPVIAILAAGFLVYAWDAVAQRLASREAT